MSMRTRRMHCECVEYSLVQVNKFDLNSCQQVGIPQIKKDDDQFNQISMSKNDNIVRLGKESYCKLQPLIIHFMLD